jgi:myo-inositol-1(or 4)-monophosphatase
VTGVDWLSTCREASAGVAEAVARLPTRLEREPGVGAGEGGDETTAVDAAAEAAVLSCLERAAAGGSGFTVVSEELGERAFGDGSSRLRVVVDPIDGSVNAKRGVPFFALSIAVADGPAMDDVFFGFVSDLGTGEEWTAERGRGARLDGALLTGPGPKEPIELLSLEATRTDLVAACVGGFVPLAERIRVVGSLALSLCHLAAGRFDAVVSLKPARSVDIAAAQLLVRERGYAVDLPEAPPFGEAPLDLAGRSRVVSAATARLCAELYGALADGLPLERSLRA